jgi:hypothetical protein
MPQTGEGGKSCLIVPKLETAVKPAAHTSAVGDTYVVMAIVFVAVLACLSWHGNFDTSEKSVDTTQPSTQSPGTGQNKTP